MELSSVAFRYGRGEPWVLKDVTALLHPGRVVEVSGPNGAGKSTLLRLLAGILRPVRGRITGRPAIVGYAPERFPASQPFTALAYLEAMARMRRIPEDVRREAIGSWAECLGFSELLNTPLAALSKGSAHKVGLTQALMTKPGLLLLDEPFAGLDRATRVVLPQVLAELASSGTTVVVSDHQNALDGMPGLDRLQVLDHAISVPAKPPPPGDRTLIEVTVRAAEADALAKRLSDEGYAVRVVTPATEGEQG